MNSKVVCTGIGAISCLGADIEEIFRNCFELKSGIELLTGPEVNNTPTVLGKAKINTDDYFTKMELTGLDRFTVLALLAAKQALNMGKVDFDFRNLRAGCFIGTGMGGATTIDQSFESHYSSDPRVSPLTVVSFMANSAAAQISIKYKIEGPSMTYSVACASSAISIGEAFKAIKSGECDYALAGGTECLLTPGVIRAWQSMRTLAKPVTESPEVSCRPFSKSRSGLVLAEGAAIMFLEREETAIKRNAKILAEVVGYGLSCDAVHIAKPDSGGQVSAMRNAIKSANILPQQIGYINTHGTATSLGDIVETQSLVKLFDGNFENTFIGSTKALHGHLLGGAGALESAICIMSLSKSQIPGSAHCKDLDPEIKVPIQQESIEGVEGYNFAMNNSFAFGGTNATLIFKNISKVKNLIHFIF